MNRLVIAPIYYFYPHIRNSFPKKVNLGNGYFLREFQSQKISDAFEFFHEAFSQWDKDELHNCRYAIYHKYSQQDDSSQTPEEVSNEIYRIVGTFRVIRPTRAVAAIFNFRVEGRRKSTIQVIHKPIQVSLPPYSPIEEHFIKSDARKLHLYLQRVRALYSTYGGTYHKALNALIFFEIGHQNQLYKPRLIHFVTCLESLFNTSDQQISYSLRMRCTLFLEKQPAARQTLVADIKKIYSLRSQFVHGQSTQSNMLNNIPEQNRLLILSENTSRKCLQKIFEKDLISLFANIQNLNAEFEKLECGLPSALS